MYGNQNGFLPGAMDSKLSAKMSKVSLNAVTSFKILYNLTNTIIALQKIKVLNGFIIIFL